MLTTLRRRVFGDADYRRYLLLLTVTGAAGSAGMPLVPLFLSQELGASLAEVGVLTVSGLLGVAVNLPVGRLSDRLRSRRPLMLVFASCMGLGWALLGFASSFWVAIGIYAVLLSAPFGTLNAQIFAALNDTMRERGESRPSTINTTLRGGYSFGYMLGPVLSTVLAASVGIRAAFWIAVAAYALVVVLASRIRPGAGPRATDTGENGAKRTGILPLALFACGLSMVIVGDMLRDVYLPIYVVEYLHQSTVAFGVLIAAIAGLEVVVFPLVGALADRFGIERVIVAALAIGVVAYAVLASSTQMWQVWLFRLLQVVLFAATIGLGLSYAQGLVPGRAGLASATFFSAQTAARPVSGLVGAAAVGGLSLPGIFWVPAGLCALCLVVFAATSLRGRKPVHEEAGVSV
ncbi:MFS transporter [Phytomonospora sp. NPDC050363]|uniref:MFS transporter n=1 Tax=Phytomonospora sp. NPDC050363 TaxID=3155642 RepID=UPI0033EAFEB5